MNDNKFKLLLGGIALAADSLFFDSSLSKIKEELLILCISLAVLSLIYLGIRKLVLHKSIAMTKTMGILVISMIIVLSIGINYLISPKKEIPPTNSLIRPTYDIPDDYKKYANLGLEDAQVFAFDMYREQGIADKRVQNNTKALEYALLASVNGDSITLLNTAFMYHDGFGTEVNYERAYFFAKMAKKKGNSKATEFIEYLIKSGLINDQDIRDMENYELKKDTNKVSLKLKRYNSLKSPTRLPCKTRWRN